MNGNLPITVLMAVHNGEKYLKEAVDSILQQTLKDFEFLIINDASTDNTTKILSEYRDGRIKIITNEQNIGLTKSLNKGLVEAKGKYIARMDADDISLPERLEVQKDFLDKNSDIVCVGSGVIIIDYLGKIKGAKTPISDPELLRFYMILKNQITHSSVMFRKSKIIENEMYNENIKYAQDYDLWSRLLLSGQKISNIQKSLLKYRLHTKSITQGDKKDMAYESAIKTTYMNMSKYIEISKLDFEYFMRSYHKHEIGSVINLYKINKIWNQFKRSYMKTEQPSVEARQIIISYINNEKINSLRWYARVRFNILYKLLIRTKRLLKKQR